MKSKKNRLILLAVIFLLLILVVKITGLLTEKTRINPIAEQTQAIVFLPATDEGTCRVIDDEKTIARLRGAYRWTNYHMFCCMEKPQAYLDVVIDGVADTRERGEYHASLLINSYNLAFRYLLHQAWSDAAEVVITHFDILDDAKLPAAQATLPDYWMYTREVSRDEGRWKLCVVSPQILTMEEKEALQSILQ